MSTERWVPLTKVREQYFQFLDVITKFHRTDQYGTPIVQDVPIIATEKVIFPFMDMMHFASNYSVQYISNSIHCFKCNTPNIILLERNWYLSMSKHLTNYVLKHIKNVHITSFWNPVTTYSINNLQFNVDTKYSHSRNLQTCATRLPLVFIKNCSQWIMITQVHVPFAFGKAINLRGLSS